MTAKYLEQSRAATL